MNLTQFAEARNVKINAVSNYISRHPEIKEHIVKMGKEVELTPKAIDILDEVYPIPKPVQVINGVDPDEYKQLQIEAEILHSKYESKLEQILELQDKLNQAQSKIAQAEATQLLLDDKQKQLENAEQRIQNLEQDVRSGSETIDGLRNENSNLKDKNQEQATEIARLKNRGFIARIFNS